MVTHNFPEHWNDVFNTHGLKRKHIASYCKMSVQRLNDLITQRTRKLGAAEFRALSKFVKDTERRDMVYKNIKSLTKALEISKGSGTKLVEIDYIIDKLEAVQ